MGGVSVPADGWWFFLGRSTCIQFLPSYCIARSLHKQHEMTGLHILILLFWIETKRF